MKRLWSFVLICSAMFLSACVRPSHAIRINESLPNNAPVEKETVVTYVQQGCPNSNGNCSLEDKEFRGHEEVIIQDVRQIEFYRYSRLTCDYAKVPDFVHEEIYYVVWYKDGVPYQSIKAFCDESSQEFKAFLVCNGENQTKELPVLKNSGEWVIDIK